MNNEVMEFDVVIVGAGPAGLSAACRLKQLALENNTALEICVVEKGAEVGAHILSGAIMDSRALDELFPGWREAGAPVDVEVKQETFSFLYNEQSALTIPGFCLPRTLHNRGNYIISLGRLCRWLAQQAESLGVNIFNGFAAAEVIYEDNAVKGIRTGAKGIGRDGEKKSSFIPAMDLRARFSVFSEGSRGHLGKELIERFALAQGRTPQHYAIGFKEIWEAPDAVERAGEILHTLGWPLGPNAAGGGFVYHSGDDQIALGLTVDLNYANPYLRPYDEFQRFKQHPRIRSYLKNARRIAYGARSITKGGYHALPRMSFPGGLLIGCDAGTLNMARLKGIHTAMKSGMLAAEAIATTIAQQADHVQSFKDSLRQSWLYSELYGARNSGAALHKFGNLGGGAFSLLEQNILRGTSFFTLKNHRADHACLRPAASSTPIAYPPYDGELSFDVLSSLVLANISHPEDQPCHLLLEDADIPINHNLPVYQEPAQRYCSAGVYEVIESDDGEALRINAQNCLHCKACDIKDPAQNIHWSAPEGGSGPNYRNM